MNKRNMPGIPNKSFKASSIEDLKNTSLRGYISERTRKFLAEHLNTHSVYNLLINDPNTIRLTEWLVFGNGNLNANTPRANELKRFVRFHKGRIRFILSKFTPSPETHGVR